MDSLSLCQTLSWSSWAPQATNSRVMAWPGGVGLGSVIPSFPSCLPSDLLANHLFPKPFRFWFKGSQRTKGFDPLSNGCHRDASACVQSRRSTHRPPLFPHRAHLTHRRSKRPVVPQPHGAAFSAVGGSAFRSLGRGQQCHTYTEHIQDHN